MHFKGRLCRNFSSHKIGNIFIELFLMLLFQLHISFFYDKWGDKYDMFLDKIILVKILIGHIFRGAYNMILDNMYFDFFFFFFFVQRERQNNISFQYCQNEDNNMHFEYSFDDFDDI